MNLEMFGAPFEFKFAANSATGEFEGYGAVFGNQDAKRDILMPTAFDDSLAQHKSDGTMPAMHVEHDWMWGGGDMPAGVWTDFAPDPHGLHAKGRISALDTDYGRRVYSLMKDGALKGLSIVFSVPPGGSEQGKKATDLRTLNKVDLYALDIVNFPANKQAQITSVKSVMANADKETATKAIASAIMLHRATMSGSDSPTAEERAQMLAHLQDGHQALTGARMPAGCKSLPQTIRELETTLREMGFSNSEARAIAERGFKSLPSRDEAGELANKAAFDDAAKEIRAAIAGLTLPKFK